MKKTTSKKITTNVTDRVHELSHVGTKEAIAELEVIVAKEKNEDIRQQAQLALEECQFFYYSPETPEEEKEFLLLKLIDKREEELFEEEMELDRFLFQEEEKDISAEITKKLIEKTKDKKQKEVYQEFLMEIPDVLTLEGKRKEEMEKSIMFLEAWLEEAYEHITIEKYKNIPPEVLFQMRSGYEDEEDNCCDEEVEEGSLDGCCGGCDDDCISF